VDIVIKRLETDEEIRGKAYVHWRAWHEAYPGLVSRDYLDKLTLEKCEEMAYRWTEGLLVAKDGDRVVGFIGCGDRGEEAPGIGEIFALYVLPGYCGTGVGRRLMEAGLERLKDYPEICLWVLKGNARAIRFYEKFGFRPDGTEEVSPRTRSTDIRMVLER
jgi:ribosomal protein S18 acetylase RimI-like enzyme